MNKKSILIVNPILFHYRRAVFLSLDSDESLEFTFAADKGGYKGINCMDPSELSNFEEISLHNIGKFEWQSGLFRLIARQQYDSIIVLGDAKILSTWIVALYARFKKIPLHFWTIGWHKPESGIKKWVRLVFYKLANSLLLYGNVGKNIGVQVGYDPSRMTVIGNSVESQTLVNNDNSISLPNKNDNELWLGAVIRPTAVKHLEMLIWAAKILLDQGVPVRILIVGNGPCTADLQKLANNVGVQAHFPGAAYTEQELKLVYSVIDITVVPAAVGLSAIQSIAHGVPVISDNSVYSQMPEWESIIPGVTGEHYAAGDVNSLVKAILKTHDRLISNREAVHTLCRTEFLDNWTAESHASRIIEAIRD